MVSMALANNCYYEIYVHYIIIWRFKVIRRKISLKAWKYHLRLKAWKYHPRPVPIFYIQLFFWGGKIYPLRWKIGITYPKSTKSLTPYPLNDVVLLNGCLKKTLKWCHTFFVDFGYVIEQAFTFSTRYERLSERIFDWVMTFWNIENI